MQHGDLLVFILPLFYFFRICLFVFLLYFFLIYKFWQVRDRENLQFLTHNIKREKIMVPTEENHITPLKIMAEEFCGKFMFAI